MDIVSGLPETASGCTGCVVFVDQLSKMTHFVAVPSTVDSEHLAQIFLDHVFRLHRMPQSIVSDRDARFMSRFWRAVFDTLESKLLYSSAYHPQTETNPLSVVTFNRRGSSRPMRGPCSSPTTSYKNFQIFHGALRGKCSGRERSR